MEDRIVILRTFPNEFEAELARTILEANEIPAMVLRDDAGGMYPSLTFVHGVRLAVHRDDVQEALEILEHAGEEEPGEPDAPWESDSAWEGDSFD